MLHINGLKAASTIIASIKCKTSLIGERIVSPIRTKIITKNYTDFGLIRPFSGLAYRSLPYLSSSQHQQHNHKLLIPFKQMSLSLSSSSFFSTIVTPTKPLFMPLSEFRDPVSRSVRAAEPVGRSWSVKELRRKSFEDLHKLWIVLYKERNMLLTEKQLSHRRSIPFPQPERIKKVRKSMGAIRQVLGERKRDHVAKLALQRLEESEKGNVLYEDELDVENEKDDDQTPPFQKA